MTPERTKSTQHLALGLVTVVSVAVSLLMLRPLLPIIAWALALSVATYPGYQRTLRYVKHPSTAAGISLTVTILLVVAPQLWVSHILIATSLEGFKAFVDRAHQEAPWNLIDLPPPVMELFRWLDTYARFGELVEGALQLVTKSIPKLVAGSLLGILELLLIFFTTFFFVRDGARLLSQSAPLLPVSSAELSLLISRAADTLHATIFGVVAVAILHGALGSLIFWMLNLPHPTIWGVVMGIFALVPYLGAFIVWIPTAIMLGISGEWKSAVILAVWGTFVIGLSDNILYPVLVGKRMHFHTVIIFLFLLGGMFVLGAAGVIIGPLSLALSYTLLEIWHKRFEEPSASPPLPREGT
jgi:predicted PurR-regulated permease PerM